MVALKNGAEEADPLVAVIMRTLHHLSDSRGLPDHRALVDIANLARDPAYDVRYTRELLQRWKLLDKTGGLHDSIRNVVLSAVELSGDEVRIVDPRAQSG